MRKILKDVAIDHCYGGAWFLPIGDVKGLRVDEGMSVLLILKRVSAPSLNPFCGPLLDEASRLQAIKENAE